MVISRPIPIEQDFACIRSVRQTNNNKTVYDSIKNNDRKKFRENINKNELYRTLCDVEMSEDEFLEKCQENDPFCKLAARLISKNASRQCSKDEAEQLRTCHITSRKCGVSITNLSPIAQRPTKAGQIVSESEMKRKKILKDDCLKSFDGKISGKMKGYIAAKVAYGSGGHQDNVFAEMHELGEWWRIHKCFEEEVLVILIDTDLIKKFAFLKEKYKDVNNIVVCNHIEFQDYIIHRYYVEDSM